MHLKCIISWATSPFPGYQEDNVPQGCQLGGQNQRERQRLISATVHIVGKVRRLLNILFDEKGAFDSNASIYSKAHFETLING